MSCSLAVDNKPQFKKKTKKQTTESDWDTLEHCQRCLGDKRKEGWVLEEIQDEGVEFEV